MIVSGIKFRPYRIRFKNVFNTAINKYEFREGIISKKRWTRYENSDLDKMIRELQIETKNENRIKIARKANDLLKNEAPWIYLWHMQSAVIAQKRIKNWEPSIMFNAEKYNNVSKGNS